MATDRDREVRELQARLEQLESLVGTNPDLAHNKAIFDAGEKQRKRYAGFTALAGVTDAAARAAQFMSLSPADRRDAARFLSPGVVRFLVGTDEATRAEFLRHVSPETRALARAATLPTTPRFALVLGPATAPRFIRVSTPEYGPLDLEVARQLKLAGLARRHLLIRRGDNGAGVGVFFVGTEARRADREPMIYTSEQLSLLRAVDPQLDGKIASHEFAVVAIDEAQSRAMDAEAQTRATNH